MRWHSNVIAYIKLAAASLHINTCFLWFGWWTVKTWYLYQTAVSLFNRLIAEAKEPLPAISQDPWVEKKDTLSVQLVQSLVADFASVLYLPNQCLCTVKTLRPVHKCKVPTSTVVYLWCLGLWRRRWPWWYLRWCRSRGSSKVNNQSSDRMLYIYLPLETLTCKKRQRYEELCGYNAKVYRELPFRFIESLSRSYLWSISLV